MAIFWGVVAVLLAILVVVSVADLARRHLGGWATGGWIALLVLFPFVGVFVYWVTRRPTPTSYGI